MDVRFILKDEGMRYDVLSKAEKINAHFLLPKGKKAKEVYVNGKECAFKTTMIAESAYVDLHVNGASKVSFEIIFE